MKRQPETRSAAKVPEIMVEVIGPDGLVHHVGPFKSHADAQAWIKRNSPDNAPAQDQIRKKFASGNARDPASSE